MPAPSGAYLKAGYLPKILREMPDGWGRDYSPNLHPSGAKYPNCLRAFFYAKRMGWVKPEFHEALNIGTVFHEAMARIRSGQTTDQACQSTYQRNMIELEALRKDYEDSHEGERHPLHFKMEKAIAMGVMLASVWNNHYPVPSTIQTLAIEQQLRITLGEVSEFLDGYLMGTIDTAFYYPRSERVWLEDHKTTSISPDERRRGLTFDIQTILYRALWDAAHPDQKAYGVIHNIIRKPTIRQRKQRQPETLEDYVSRCFEWYEEKFLGDPQHPPMIQSMVAFTRPPLAEDAEIIRLLQRLCQCHYVDRPVLSSFPRVGTSFGGCHGTYGKTCPYMDLCEREDPAHWFNVLISSGYAKIDPDTRDILDD